jgi:hypothetical protein
MSENKQAVLFIIAGLLVAGGVWLSGRVVGYQHGYRAGEKQMMDDAVQWCAEAMMKVCPDADMNKLRPQQNNKLKQDKPKKGWSET